MRKASAMPRPAQNDALTFGVLRFTFVAGCATALIMARYPLPF